MAYPSNDDPDLNKAYKQRGDKPAAGRKDAHRDQTPRKETPQHQAQEDRRLREEGER